MDAQVIFATQQAKVPLFINHTLMWVWLVEAQQVI
jgi:hypothetical protein